MKHFSFLRLIALAACALLSPAPGRADLIIDNFSSGPLSLLNTTPLTTVSGGSSGLGSGTLGGARSLSITNGANVFSSTLTVTPALGRLDFASQVAPPPNGTSFLLKYDGSPGPLLNPAGLGGLNLLSQGGIGITLVGNNTSNAVEEVTYTVYSNATSYSTATVAIPSGAANLSQTVLFTSFTQGTGAAAAANFADVGALTVAIQYGNRQGSSGSITLVGVASVPEPAPLVLGSLGLCVFVLTAIRRARRSSRVS
ncbi:MAG: hypothetical protein U0835_05685 [Isosphaeraceae bacterium]